MKRLSAFTLPFTLIAACAATAPMPEEPASAPATATAPQPSPVVEEISAPAPPPDREPAAPGDQPLRLIIRSSENAPAPQQDAPITDTTPTQVVAPTLESQPLRVQDPELRATIRPQFTSMWNFVVDGDVLDFPDPLVAAEPGATLHVALELADATAAQWERSGAVQRMREAGPPQEVRFQMQMDYTWEASAGILDPGETVNNVLWELPSDPSTTSLVVRGSTTGEARSTASGSEALTLSADGEHLSVQVLTPYDRSSQVVGTFPIGVYPNESGNTAPGPVARRPDAYRPPMHFWHVTDETQGAHIAPHVRLGDLCSVPMVNGEAYIAIAPRLITRLGALQAACEDRNWLAPDGSGLTILRGYLTPGRLLQMRQAGANISTFTRHLYGDAAIVIIDADGDGAMDDLNRDGVIDVADAQALAGEIEALESTWGSGGLGVFAERPAGDPELPDTPMVQFDCRGERARW